jgi:hypothetical protein
MEEPTYGHFKRYPLGILNNHISTFYTRSVLF